MRMLLKVSIPVEASFDFSRGLDYEHRGQKDRAAVMYQKALQVFPEHKDAQAALERIKGKGGKS